MFWALWDLQHRGQHIPDLQDACHLNDPMNEFFRVRVYPFTSISSWSYTKKYSKMKCKSHKLTGQRGREREWKRRAVTNTLEGEQMRTVLGFGFLHPAKNKKSMRQGPKSNKQSLSAESLKGSEIKAPVTLKEEVREQGWRLRKRLEVFIYYYIHISRPAYPTKRWYGCGTLTCVLQSWGITHA